MVVEPIQSSLPPSNSPAISGPGDATVRLTRSFSLTRYFSIASLLGMIVVMTVLVLIYRYLAFAALAQHETRDNINITQIFASTIWRKHADYVKGASAIPIGELQRRPEVARIREDVLHQMKGLLVVKVKIYNLDGLTVFSTDPAQIGEDKSTNSGFLMAKSGETVSDITFRDRFDAFERVINDRSLISSYVPIRTSLDTPTEGVMEVYSDVTPYVEKLQTTTWVIASGVLGSLSILYLFLLAIVRRADRLIATQAEEVRVAHLALLQYRALHDTLTGLPNRVSFTERLEALLTHARRDAEKCAVLFLNIDRFKDINETLGHLVGDRILREVATRLLLCQRESENLARIGGDDFALVLPNVSGTRGVEQILHTAERIRGAISDNAFVIDANELMVTISIGIALYPDDGTDVVELMKSADVALYHAKEAGRNQFQFHTSGMNARALEMLLMERDLRLALEKQQFQLYYQAQVDIESGHIVGVEALIRWQHPERGMVGPAKFIPIAEERDLIGRIEAWVIHEACRQNKQWQDEGLPAVPVAVNISALHFQQKTFSQEVAGILAQSGLAPEYLELELTESSILRDADTTISTMNRLKGLGLKLSLDDFGTGYSSLSQLKRLPLDALKVDQSFVRGLPDDADDLAITTAIIQLGKALNLTVIAEGVETDQQREVLRSRQCDQIQGYLVAKPMPAADFARFVQQRAKPPSPAGKTLS